MIRVGGGLAGTPHSADPLFAFCHPPRSRVNDPEEFATRVTVGSTPTPGDARLVEHTRKEAYWGNGGDGCGKNSNESCAFDNKQRGYIDGNLYSGVWWAKPG